MLIIAHDQTSRTGIDRVAGFTNEIKDKYPDITIVDTQYGAGDQLKSTDLAKAIIQAHPNLKGFFGANEGSIIGVLNGVNELNKAGKIVVIGYDSGQQQLDAIRSGEEVRRDHPGPDRHWLQGRRSRRHGDSRRNPPQDHRHRFPLVRQDQHRRPGDRRGAVQMIERRFP